MCTTSSVAVFGLRGFALLPGISVCSMADPKGSDMQVVAKMKLIGEHLKQVRDFIDILGERHPTNPCVTSPAASLQAAQDDLQELIKMLRARMSTSRRHSRNKMGAVAENGHASRSRPSSAASSGPSAASSDLWEVAGHALPESEKQFMDFDEWWERKNGLTRGTWIFRGFVSRRSDNGRSPMRMTVASGSSSVKIGTCIAYSVRNV